MSENCLFCRIVSGEIPSASVYRDDRVMAFDDINPAAPTHALVVPVEHLGALRALDPGREELLGHMMSVAARVAAERGVSESGYRLVVNQGADAGQVVDHLHMHVLGGRSLGALG